MKLNKKHQKAIHMLFEGSLKRREIAEELKVSEQTLYNWLKDEDFTKAYDEYVQQIMGKSSGKALNTMLKLMNARSEMVRFNAAKDILDRGGYAPVTKQEVTNIQTPVFEDDIGDEDG
ncbi:helix-turn-helix domain-containing protein [Enterococcus ureasiticus]|uniref:phBC6A51 family helix-turn-helix protein n=1 Tax=Enterococcus ureasiticus TaxID=903984 RepID=UPI001A9081BF|nr:phBC6A51 family helix-turn-helix protein [Enterococcus ureasiticus]MBO0473254.1 helix-turn-helix domain-containing protein [Enterococcus ureasiticus]